MVVPVRSRPEVHTAAWRNWLAQDAYTIKVPGSSPGAATNRNEMKASEIQQGGEHYKKYAIQPTEFIHANNVGFIEGNVIKYVLRHRDKNGLEDLKKAKHYIELLMEFEYPSDNTK